MKTFQQLLDAVPEEIVYDEGFKIVDAVRCSKHGNDLAESILEGDALKAKIILKLYCKTEQQLKEAHRYIFQ